MKQTWKSTGKQAWFQWIWTLEWIFLLAPVREHHVIMGSLSGSEHGVETFYHLSDQRKSSSNGSFHCHKHSNHQLIYTQHHRPRSFDVLKLIHPSSIRTFVPNSHIVIKKIMSNHVTQIMTSDLYLFSCFLCIRSLVLHLFFVSRVCVTHIYLDLWDAKLCK